MFGISYHQCRWNYNDQDDVKQVDAGFDEHDLPYDVIWLDIEHTDNKKYMTWDALKFSDSEGMVNHIASKGRKMVTIVDPHIKRDSNYHIHKEAQSKRRMAQIMKAGVGQGHRHGLILQTQTPEVGGLASFTWISTKYVGKNFDFNFVLEFVRV